MRHRPRRRARVRFAAISMRPRRRWRRFAVQYGAVLVSALFCAHALLTVTAALEQLHGPAECGVPVFSAAEAGQYERWSGVAAAADLPWSAAPPPALTALWDRLGSARLVTAFRITLPNPLWNEADNVALAASLLAGTFIAPGETVSVIGLIGPLTKERGYGDGPGYADGRLVPVQAGGVCKIGTAVYNVAVYGGLTVLERHPHSMIVPYVHPGRDAAIATGHKDVRVRNDYGRPVGLWAAFADNTLFVALFGDVDAPSVRWQHEELARVPAPRERRPNPGLPAGAEQLVFAGYDGVTVRTSIIVQRPGRPPEAKLLSVDTYRPLPGVVEYGP